MAVLGTLFNINSNVRGVISVALMGHCAGCICIDRSAFRGIGMRYQPNWKTFGDLYTFYLFFLGANMDAVSIAGRMGIAPERSARFHNDGIGIAKNFSVVAESMAKMSKGYTLAAGELDEIREDYACRVK